MKSKKNLSNLASRICYSLLKNKDTFDIHCPDTGGTIKAKTEFKSAWRLNKAALGAHFTAYGYHYVLCLDTYTNELYVSIINDKTKTEVACIDNNNFYDEA
jgi:hypothetical protein